MSSTDKKYLPAATRDLDLPSSLDDDEVTFTSVVKPGIRGRRRLVTLLGLALLFLILVALVVAACVMLLPKRPDKRLELEVEQLEDVVERLVEEEEAVDCLADLDLGPCLAAVPRWFYNKDKGQCDQVRYTKDVQFQNILF